MSSDFIQFALAKEVLRFGEFTLKSGRLSPYFFNSGLFNDGESLAKLGEFYAQSIIDSGIEFDMLFGPAYKGIPLASAASVALFKQHGRSVPYACDRKEAKDHGEGGITFGAPLEGKVMIIDDVISAGTSVNHSIDIIRAAGAEPAAVIVALDRQERGYEGDFSAIQEVERKQGIKVISINNLDDIMTFIESDSEHNQHLDAVKSYRAEYGVKA